MRWLASAIVLGTAGCASAPPPVASSRGDVVYRTLDAPGERYALREEEDFRLGRVRPDTRALPVYPPAWLAMAPEAVWICTELHIDETGAVYGARAVYQDDCNARETAWDADFRAAVDAATRGWVYEPSYRCVLADGAERDHECRDARELTAVPVSRAYRFRFRRTPQGGVVEGGD